MESFKLGHGSSLPDVGQSFYLPIVETRWGPAFQFSNLTHSGITFRVFYSVRSSARLVPFKAGQVWKVCAARLRRLPLHSDLPVPATVVRLDLQEVYSLRIGRFDPFAKQWLEFPPPGRSQTTPKKIPATVRYSEYLFIGKDEDAPRLHRGYFAEVLSDSTGEVLVRYPLQKGKSRTDADVDPSDVPALPNDGVPIARGRGITSAVRFIREWIGSRQ